MSCGDEGGILISSIQISAKEHMVKLSAMQGISGIFSIRKKGTTEDKTEFGKAKFYLASCANLLGSLLLQYHIIIMWAQEIISSRNYFSLPRIIDSIVLLVLLKNA